MACFLIATIPVVGHVFPALPIARRLVERGHKVYWYTGKAFQSTIEKTSAQYIPIIEGLDFSNPSNVPNHLIEERKKLSKLAQFKFDIKHFFIDSAISQVEDLTKLLKEISVDIVLSDFCFLGSAWIYEKGGPPWVSFGTSALPFNSKDTAPYGLGLKPTSSLPGRWRNSFLNWTFDQVLLADISTYIATAKSKIGLPKSHKSFFDSCLSPFLYLQGTVPAFEYPRQDMPSQIQFVGPFLPEPPDSFVPPTWWQELEQNKPVIHVTQGTVATDIKELILPTLEALAGEDLLVVVTMGKESTEDIEFIRKNFQNARVENFIPHFYLLPHTDIMITNGGYNGVHIALANGVPLIAAGQSEDKPEICSRIEWAGVGINLKTSKPQPKQIKAAVNQILKSPVYKQKAQLMKAEIMQYDSAQKSVDLLEQLLINKQLILK
ncbi:glycosyltransferase [Chlorogloea sp. CCALA 695]|uniref:glycosyltransferase n=1 Tax=Chlorogloea sp. CCALA 695 TaxID=2107693 RepID=UPI000D05A5E5|nr:nucleotide disphospho-sugar-binding domain-containing protein [Chlorogloea sp. CCALA 695]PSB28924.1 glycosyltransferase [Chlorogloea sp. CCALA 695]